MTPPAPESPAAPLAEPDLAEHDVTDATVMLEPPSLALPPVTSRSARVRALWCAFVSGLG